MGSLPSKDYCDVVEHEIKRRAKGCVHYCAVDRVQHSENSGCARGVPIEAKAIKANGGSRLGIALRLPCDKVSPDPLFSCPWFEARGVDRATDDMIAIREAGARTLKALAKRLHKKER